MAFSPGEADGADGADGSVELMVSSKGIGARQCTVLA